MQTPGEYTTRQLEYFRWQLGCDELKRLFSIASEGFSADDVVVSTVRDHTRFNRKSLEELVTTIASAATAGDPQAWTNVRLEAGKVDDARRIDLAIDHGRLTASVEGPDATWVFGQTARLEMFVVAAHGSKVPATMSGADWAWLVGLAALGTPLLLRYGAVGVIGELLAVMNSVVITARLKRRQAARLHVATPLPPRGIREHVKAAGWVVSFNIGFAAIAAIPAWVAMLR
ncbi:hypothetical protein ABZX77_18150 [Streptomyces sp. NPDC004237]|uniref:hypothetical protein n=1 Tax=Streptomyces sp. NPDC004237 TaxID=3154455 RepID=UPI0033A4BCDE